MGEMVVSSLMVEKHLAANWEEALRMYESSGSLLSITMVLLSKS